MIPGSVNYVKNRKNNVKNPNEILLINNGLLASHINNP